MRSGEHSGRGGRPPGGWGSGEQSDGEVAAAWPRGQGRVDPGGGEPSADGIPRVGAAQSLPDEVGEDAGAEIVVVAIGDHDEPVTFAMLGQHLTDRQGRFRWAYPDSLTVMRHVGLHGRVGRATDADDTAAVVLGPRFVDDGEHH